MANRPARPFAASASDDQTDRFLALLAHELRSPLGPLRTSIELLNRDNVPEEAKARARQVMLRQVLAMARLIDELSDIASAGEGRMELHRERADLNDVINAAIDSARVVIEDKELRLSLDLPTDGAWLDIDRSRITQAIACLLNEAVRRSERGRRLWLRAAVDQGIAAIAIREEGSGLADDTSLRLFRLLPPLVVAEAGAGENAPSPMHDVTLAATLARRLVELHDGSLRWHTETAGEGSEVAVYLPVSRAGKSPDGERF